MTLKIEDKRLLAARAFYQDNVDEYENFDMALNEMSHVSEDFLNTVVEMNTKVSDGYRVLMDEGGYLISVNNETSHVLPLSEITEEIGGEIQKKTTKILKENPNLSPVLVMQQIGFKLV